MAAATRQGDCCTGHDACSPTSLVGCSPDVFINGKGAGRVGDGYAPHGCVAHPSHSDHISSGSSTVFINGIPAARIGDAVTLAGSVRDGSSNVFIGG
jgi:uncharacterized Zn-binding protein involved in type VI secretion